MSLIQSDVKQEQKVESSTPNPDAKIAESSTAKTEETTQAKESLADVIEKAAGVSESQAELKKPESPVQELHETEEEKQAREVKEEAERASGQKGEEKKDEDSKLPFHDHPRWKEVLGQRNEYEQQVQRLKPLAEQQQSIVDYCTKSGVSGEEFQQALEIAALLKSDPQGALEKLTPIVTGLKVLGGESLPKDLEEEFVQIQTELADGTISEATAKRYEQRLRETAKLRAQQLFKGEQGKQAEQRQREQMVLNATTAVNEWQEAKMKSDPDYRPKAKDTDPLGKFELVDREFNYLTNAALQKGQNILNPKLVTQIAEQAYANIQATTNQWRPQPKERKGLPTTNSSGIDPKGEPKTLHEAVERALVRNGR